MIQIVLLAFIAGSIAAVIKVVRQIVSERKCVTDYEIGKFYKGTLKHDDAIYRRFIAHLGICEKCQTRLHSFQKVDDVGDHFLSKEH